MPIAFACVMSVLLLGSSVALAAAANPNAPATAQEIARADKVYENIRIRIDSGVQQRQLTSQEAASARSAYDSIGQLWKDARADRKITVAELQNIDSRQAALNKSVYANRHDADPNDLANVQDIAKAEKSYENTRIRIENGVKQNQLTPSEAARARADYDSIGTLWSDARADRKITVAELRNIVTRQAALNKFVYNNRNDAEGESAKAMVDKARMNKY